MSNLFRTIAYHTNDATVASKNVTMQTFFISHDKPEKELWLGDGIYFWERQKDAEWWPGKFNNGTILKATLSCQNDQYVNLDLKEELEAFQAFCRQTKEQMGSLNGKSFDFSRGRFQVSSFFFNVFKDTYGVLLLKYSFPRINNRPQYCASNNDVVSDIQLVARMIANRWEWY